MKKKNKLSWKIGGEAGFGIKSAGMMLGKIFMRSGYEMFDYTEYPSLIRGSHNAFQLMVDTSSVNSITKEVDILIALNKNAIKKHKEEVNSKGIIIFDSNIVKLSNSNAIGIPLTDIAKESGNILMRNVITLGATLALVGQDLTIANKVIKDTFSSKGDEVVNNNKKALKKGFQYIKDNYKKQFICYLPKLKAKDKILLEANQALALGALAGGLNFYVAYPMTPSSSILHYLAKVAVETNTVVKHAEDEIAVINMALGASHAGARAMVGTSGGGFALMTEALGLTGLTETPLVLVNVQRGGPATGIPTWTEQGDLQFILRAAQGDFPRIILTPGDVQEAFELGAEAMNLADMYQVPVIILSDKYIAEGNTTVDKFKIKNIKINRGKLLTQAELNKIKKYERYKLVKDGVSPRTVPGMKNGLYIANSDEHNAYGFSEESSKNRIDQVDKRARKLETFKKKMPLPVIYGNPKAKNTVVIWGSNKGPLLDGYNLLSKKEQKKIKIMHIKYMWPFPDKFVLDTLSKSNNVLLIENNSTSHLGDLIAQETGIIIKNKLLKYDGRPFFREEIIKALKQFI